jgi:glycosyltransferase involved in cell wall biosynthesis
MKLLFLSHEIPSPAASDTLAVYQLIRHLSVLCGHDITLISFMSERSRAEDFEHLKNVCTIEDPIRIQWDTLTKMLLKAAKNSILNLPKNLKHGLYVNELDYYYDQRMDQKINEALKKKNFELIFSTRQMANYVVDVDVPKIVQPFDAMSEWHKQVSSNSHGLKRIFYFIRFALNQSYERHIYENFDACLVVTQLDKELLQSVNPRIRCEVIPIGVDAEYFSPANIDEESTSLIFIADMSESRRVAVDNIICFYNEIFPLILRKNPDVKLYLVGRDPSKEILKLSADHLVTVTGYVTDVRPYLAKSTVSIVPWFIGAGMKYKVLEAMSMGKAVVTTTNGARGIAAKNKEHLVIADNFNEFARETLALLNDQSLRHRLGENARRLVEVQYSWEVVTKTLNEVLLNVLRARQQPFIHIHERNSV